MMTTHGDQPTVEQKQTRLLQSRNYKKKRKSVLDASVTIYLNAEAELPPY